MSLAAFTTHRPAGATYGRDEGAALRALLSRGADDVSVVSNAPFALQEELEALRVAQGCRIKHT